MNTKKVALIIKCYASSMLLIWVALLFYRHNVYYEHFLSNETQNTLIILGLAYTLLAPVAFIFLPSKALINSKGLVFFGSLGHLLPAYVRYLRNFTRSEKYPLPKLKHQENTAILFILVKFFFLPLMLNFLFVNFYSVKNGLENASSTGQLLSVDSFNSILFPLIFATLILIDTAYFTFGYIAEAGFLGNKVRSVEPTALGWFVALISYPPFNGFLATYVIFQANEYVDFGSATTNFIMRIIILCLITVYTLSSVALGAKASNLTNRGIVSRGPYAFVRHPAYITKNLAWWLAIIPIFSLTAATGMAIWSLIYFLRAITEERHLIRDPDYQVYCKKVKYRFIPGVI